MTSSVPGRHWWAQQDGSRWHTVTTVGFGSLSKNGFHQIYLHRVLITGHFHDRKCRISTGTAFVHNSTGWRATASRECMKLLPNAYNLSNPFRGNVTPPVLASGLMHSPNASLDPESTYFLVQKHKDIIVVGTAWLEVFEFRLILVLHFLGIWGVIFARWIVIVEVAAVCGVFDLGNDWPFDFAMIHGFPVNILEKGMGFDGSGAAHAVDCDVAKSVGGIDCTKTTNKIAGIRRHSLWILHFAFNDTRWDRLCQNTRTNQNWRQEKN